jgi:two-component system, chemotaxis family, sensor kinase CheA
MSSEMESLHEVFFEEAAELILEMENTFLSLETTPEDEELLNTIFRCVHSIKGAASMFGFTELNQFAHGFESVLDLLRHRRIDATPALFNLLLSASDVLKSLLAQLKGEGVVDPGARDAVAAELQHLLATHTTTTADAPPPKPSQSSSPAPNPRMYAIYFKPRADILRRGLDPIEMFEALARLGEVLTVDVDLSSLPPLAALDPEECYLGWTIYLRSAHGAAILEEPFEAARAESVLRIAESEPSPLSVPSAPEFTEVPLLGELLLQDDAVTPQQLDAALSTQKKVGQVLVEQQAVKPEHLTQALEKQQNLRHKQEVSSIRVNIDKVDKLINLVGELVITQSMVAQLVAGFTPDRLPQLQEAVTQMDRHARELQERVMAVRMVPIRTLFSRFPRVVRDLAQAQHKQVGLEMAGEDTELDKTVIEQIGDPLTHLVRNAIDHGIEPSDVRQQVGKPATGHLYLKAYQQSGNIYIEVADDGKGLDRERILAKAAQNGLIGPEQALTDEEVFALIFRPGLSTAEKVTEVSGRGVGMDVVKRNVEALSGSITIHSERGRGTTFKIKLPLTLAILDGQLLQVGGERYIMPLVSIVESMRPRQESLNRVLGEAEAITIRGQVLPLLRLHRLFDVSPRTEDPSQGLVVIVEHEGRKVALLVDELLGQQQVVIKSLEANFKKVDGVSGATILGDGCVALILDVPGLVALSQADRGRPCKLLVGVGQAVLHD